MRLIFMGTPDFAVPTLASLLEAGHEITCVYSQPPRPAGRRGLELQKSPVHTFAEEQGIEVRTPINFKGQEERKEFCDLKAEAAIVVAYGLILPRSILEAPKHGCFNGHASLLPRWRGAAPIQRAIMAGDKKTGVTIMKMDEGLDTGDMCLTERIAITPKTTANTLHDELSVLTGRLMVEAMSKLSDGDLVATPQPDAGVTYAAKIDKVEAAIDWSFPARDIDTKIRGLSPFPGAYADVGGKRIKLLSSAIADGEGEPGQILDDHLTVACGEGAVRLLTLQPAGKKPMDAASFLNGHRLVKGDRFA